MDIVCSAMPKKWAYAMQVRDNLFRIGRRDAKFICVTIMLTILLRVC